jgi:hypothetical protein
MKKLLEEQPADALVHENAFLLLDAAFAERGEKGIEPDWRLPAEISTLEVLERRLEYVGDAVKFQIRVSGNGTYRSLDQVQLVRYPGTILIDKRKHLGRGTEFPPGRQEVEYQFHYHSEEIERPVDDGLFWLKFQFGGGQQWEGWFILSHLWPSASPRILVPHGQIVDTGRPTVLWADYVSDGYRPFEQRAVLGRLTPRSNQLTGWWFRRGLPSRASSAPLQATVGIDGRLLGAKELDGGEYWLSIGHEEIKHLGPVVIVRQAMSVLPVVIRKP